MCGRFTLYDKEGIKKKFSVDITLSYNVAPSQNVLVIDSQPHIRDGFLPRTGQKKISI